MTIKACLFDMDGTLLNTEDLYTESIDIILKRYNKGPFTWDVKIHVQGMPGPQAQRYVIDSYDLPVTPEEYGRIALEVQSALWHRSQWLPGAQDLLKRLKQEGIAVALGTSSGLANYNLKTKHLDFSVFGKHIVTGDDPRIPPGRGKPNPDIWYACLDSINVERRAAGEEEIRIDECLVFEDGLPGVRSGISAGALVIWIPHTEAVPLLGENKLLVKDRGEMLGLLEDFHYDKWFGKA